MKSDIPGIISKQLNFMLRKKHKLATIYHYFDIIIFCLSCTILLGYGIYCFVVEMNQNQFQNEKKLTQSMIQRAPQNKLCDSISNIYFDEYFLKIEVTEPFSSDSMKTLQNILYFHTQAFERPLVFPFNKSIINSTSSRFFSFLFPFPFLGTHIGKLICAPYLPDSKSELLLSSFNFYVYKCWNLTLHISSFFTDFVSHFQTKSEIEQYKQYSQLKCNGEYIVRRCESRNIFYIQGFFKFYSPVIYNFPKSLLPLSHRAPPYDRPEAHVQNIVVIPEITSSFKQLKIQKIFLSSYLCSRFFNSMMLFHILFDLLVPLYGTIYATEGSVIGKDRYIFFYDEEYPVHEELFTIFAKEKPINLYKNQKNYFFSKLYMGNIKFEENPHLFRTWNEMFVFRYNYNKTTSPGLREKILEYYNFTPTIKPDHPIITFHKRSSRIIVNSNEMVEFFQKSCPYCEIKFLDFASISFKEQIFLSANSSVMIGLHGSGLANVLWMGPSKKYHTSLVELFPYNYWCRDWYHTASNVAEINYYSFMTDIKENFTNSETFHDIQICWNQPELCPTRLCHDILRDQNATLNLTEFAKIWKPIQDELDKHRYDKYD